MRIAYVLTSLGIGGAERQVLALAERMEERGHAVLLVVLLPSLPEEWPTSLKVVRLGMCKSPFSLIASLFRARRVLRAFKPDLMHSHTFPANMAARLLQLLHRPSPPLICTLHNNGESSRLRMLAYRLTDSLCRRTTAVSMAAAESYVAQKAVPAHKVMVIANGIDTVEFAPNSDRRARLRREMGAHKQFVWLAAGRIVPAKDYPNLQQAFAIVRAADPAARLWIAGEAAENEPASMRSLETELGLEEAVYWLGLRRDMPALMDAADGFVLSSAWEGMPLALGEAMAMQKPVVATDVGGVREMVGDEGLIVPPKSPEALAQAMLTVMCCEPEGRHALGHAARKRIQSHFSMETKADEWEAFYRAELGSDRR